MSIITGSLQAVNGVYPLRRNSDKRFAFDLHPWGVSVRRNETVNAKPEPPHGTRNIKRMSTTTKKRIIKYTSMLEFFGVIPTHMLTLTLPPSRFEKLSDDEKVATWNFAKAYFLKALQKKLSREVPGYGDLSFQEFQTRGAPHLHIILRLRKMHKKEWSKWLQWFVKTWKKALKWDEETDGIYPNQGVDFHRLRYSDFRYVRAYMNKNEQKEAPFSANWGRWWSVGGSMRLNRVSRQYDVKLQEEEIKKLNDVIGNYKWLTWSKIKQLEPLLYEKLVSHIQRERWQHDDTIKHKKYKCVYTAKELEIMNQIYWFAMEMNEERLE
ncbi:MAG: hypothetical protein C0175_06250 [Caldisericum exile]|uniref:Replication-associated protein ORF2/G2P domain-containing protein n=1 Tax=Caldisericum exile TaxID=693075 RepID=A0A2J6X410_9BACT|nr:MAG: hypothetical protein C0175_06250 [Caldisericum exile]